MPSLSHDQGSGYMDCGKGTDARGVVTWAVGLVTEAVNNVIYHVKGGDFKS